MWHFGVDVFLLLLYFTGVLLPELVVSIILLLTIDAGLMQETGSIPLLAGLLEHLDRFNHLAPGHERDDNEDLAWPGIMGTILLGVFHFCGFKIIMKKDLCFVSWLTKINFYTAFYFPCAGSFFAGQSIKNNEEVSLIRKADLENHNKDGGFWTVIDGKVYDIKDFQAQSLTGNSILGKILTINLEQYELSFV